MEPVLDWQGGGWLGPGGSKRRGISSSLWQTSLSSVRFSRLFDDGVDTGNDHNEHGPPLQGDPPHPVSRGGGGDGGGRL